MRSVAELCEADSGELRNGDAGLHGFLLTRREECVNGSPEMMGHPPSQEGLLRMKTAGGGVQ